MDSIEDPFKLLGVTHDTAWTEVTRSYRDLIKVWHPDRFQSDERLRKKAEKETRKLNLAYEELKTFFQSPRTSQTVFNKPNHSSNNFTKPSPQATNFSQTESVNQNFSFAVSPLEVKVKVLTAIRRLIGSTLILMSAVYILMLSYEPLSAVIGSIMSLFAIYWAVTNLWLLLSRSSVIRVSKEGIFNLMDGLLPWGSFLAVRTSRSSGLPTLSIDLSPDYLQKIHYLKASIYKLRHYIRGGHVIAPLHGLSQSGISIVRAIQLQQASGEIQIDSKVEHNFYVLSKCSLLLGFASALALIARIIFRYTHFNFEYVLYLSCFAFFMFAALVFNSLSIRKFTRVNRPV